jgi:hypothetical protein
MIHDLTHVDVKNAFTLVHTSHDDKPIAVFSTKTQQEKSSWIVELNKALEAEAKTLSGLSKKSRSPSGASTSEHSSPRNSATLSDSGGNYGSLTKMAVQFLASGISPDTHVVSSLSGSI